MHLKNQPTGKADHVRCALDVHTALALMLHGKARREEWASCADAINMVEALLFFGKVPADPYLGYVHKAIDGMVEAIECQPGQMRMNADAARALKAIVCQYDECIGKMARVTIDGAAKRVILKIAEQRTNPENGVRVVEA